MVDQLSREELVKVATAQQKLIEKSQLQLEKLQHRQPSNSKTLSKPPSSALIQKSETAPVDNSKESESEPKRKPGGQPGHIGKTRTGFGRVDRYQISTPDCCERCGSKECCQRVTRKQRAIKHQQREANFPKQVKFSALMMV